ncbi:gata zinc finger domain-containing protein 10-related [Anaeramoeba flamelloides]|uniref:Gata zinc finger domain-containing protein 10-related n=1 Tax=Anaeramoeba flamelloides TaxID=1746091 RepID=A0AAV7Y0T6_9EUKA|nr:gata zinc finger domain-containing protein 10-related [Anaeramoeba flamelloides]
MDKKRVKLLNRSNQFVVWVFSTKSFTLLRNEILNAETSYEYHYPNYVCYSTSYYISYYNPGCYVPAEILTHLLGLGTPQVRNILCTVYFPLNRGALLSVFLFAEEEGCKTAVEWCLSQEPYLSDFELLLIASSMNYESIRVRLIRHVFTLNEKIRQDPKYRALLIVNAISNNSKRQKILSKLNHSLFQTKKQNKKKKHNQNKNKEHQKDQNKKPNHNNENETTNKNSFQQECQKILKKKRKLLGDCVCGCSIGYLIKNNYVLVKEFAGIGKSSWVQLVHLKGNKKKMFVVKTRTQTEPHKTETLRKQLLKGQFWNQIKLSDLEWDLKTYHTTSNDQPKSYVILQQYVPGKTLKQLMKEDVSRVFKQESVYCKSLVQFYRNAIQSGYYISGLNYENFIFRESDSRFILIDSDTIYYLDTINELWHKYRSEMFSKWTRQEDFVFIQPISIFVNYFEKEVLPGLKINRKVNPEKEVYISKEEYLYHYNLVFEEDTTTKTVYNPRPNKKIVL